MNPQQAYAQMAQWGAGTMAGPRLGAPGFPPGYPMGQQQGFPMGAPAGYGYPMGAQPQAGFGMGAQFGVGGPSSQPAAYTAPFAQQPVIQKPAFPQQQLPATVRGPVPVAAPAAVAAPVSAAAPGKWAVPDNVVRKESYQFSLLDRQRQGFLARGEMQAVLTRTNLPAPALASIWCAHCRTKRVTLLVQYRRTRRNDFVSPF